MERFGGDVGRRVICGVWLIGQVDGTFGQHEQRLHIISLEEHTHICTFLFLLLPFYACKGGSFVPFPLPSYIHATLPPDARAWDATTLSATILGIPFGLSHTARAKPATALQRTHTCIYLPACAFCLPISSSARIAYAYLAIFLLRAGSFTAASCHLPHTPRPLPTAAHRWRAKQALLQHRACLPIPACLACSSHTHLLPPDCIATPYHCLCAGNATHLHFGFTAQNMLYAHGDRRLPYGFGLVCAPAQNAAFVLPHRTRASHRLRA